MTIRYNLHTQKGDQGSLEKGESMAGRGRGKNKKKEKATTKKKNLVHRGTGGNKPPCKRR